MKKRIVTVMTIALLTLASLTGCGGADSGAANSAAPAYEREDRTADSGLGYGGYGDYGDYTAEFDAAEAWDGYSNEADESLEYAIPGFLDPDNQWGIKLVYTVEMSLQTTAFPQGTRKLLDTAEEMGGFVRSTHVEGRSLYSPDAPRFARYTLSIPTTRLAEFLVEMEDNFNQLYLNQESRDITSRYAASSGELDALQDQEQELIALLEQLDEEEYELRAELEWTLYSLRQQMNSLGVAVSGMDIDNYYSTVTLHLYEVVDLDGFLAGEEEPQPFGERFRETASNSVSSFVGFWQGALLWLTSAWPVLVVLALLAILAWLLLVKAGLPARLRGLGERGASPSPQTLPERPAEAPVAQTVSQAESETGPQERPEE